MRPIKLLITGVGGSLPKGVFRRGVNFIYLSLFFIILRFNILSLWPNVFTLLAHIILTLSLGLAV